MNTAQQNPEALLATIQDEVRRCYEASNQFTDETREQLLAGARELENAHASVVRRS